MIKSKKKKKKKKTPLLVCTSFSAGQVCSHVASSLNWRYSTFKNDQPHGTVTWVGTHKELDDITSSAFSSFLPFKVVVISAASPRFQY